MLREIFNQLFLLYSNSTELCNFYWKELEDNYSNNKRHYHNLTHLEHIYQELLNCKTQIEDWNTIMFALFYHDVVYKIRRKDNEEQSAIVAVKRLKNIHYPSAKSALCSQHILATKTHIESKSSDTNFFIDADLAILGTNNEVYFTYVQQIRKEYAFYPDFLYKHSRKKVLQHFLEMDRIYKTKYFFDLYEAQAKENIWQEMNML